ncbi:mannosyl-oligosaccharide glucosidase [Malassezia psittaci]|uniref:Mannosyl-oligosaccharide glucosidase n=1 Tax=Malassezia psittaci TaxID=1821823 RepID=A0AAF0F7Z8_9BASI|nr:mannosyl-oligosaccharide glucosidase [Malassezia psittaci]
MVHAWVLVVGLNVWVSTVVALATGANGDAFPLWGTYRPQVYLGMRPRIANSMLSGLAYYGTRSVSDVKHWRHTTQDDDGVRYYRWTHHDGKCFGSQEIIDDALNYKIETSFVHWGGSPSSDHPRNWAIRVQGTVLDDDVAAAISLMYYVGQETADAELSIEQEDGQVVVRGRHPALEPFTLRFGKDHQETHYSGMHVPVDQVWRAKEPILGMLTNRVQTLSSQRSQQGETLTPAQLLQLPDISDPDSTLLTLQRSFTGNFTLDIFFNSEPNESHLESEQLTELIRSRREAYENQFREKFPLDEFSEEDKKAARELTAQIVGGVGYYAGSSLVDRRRINDAQLVLHEPQKAQPTREPPSELLTATPSRSFFPRGFYWDEGFHLMHIATWDADLALQLFSSWTSQIDQDGWVAREQILGAEARSRVPEEFQVQFPQFANPPTLIMGLEAYFAEQQPDSLQSGVSGVAGQVPFIQANESSQIDLASLYEPWRRHYEWFRRTQQGQIQQWDRAATSKREGYRWRGRSLKHVLTSGLDDYPRAEKPHVGELHLDLLAWMGGFARAMHDFAQRLGLEEDVHTYKRHYDAICANIYDLHWSEEQQMFCDASVDDDDESYFECHPGYVTLFPFLMELLQPDAVALGKTLDMLQDPDQLWSPYGLRSLSHKHPLYGTDEDYWRGAVWIPLNYLALRALRRYAQQAGPYQNRAEELYMALRRNVVRVVLDEYKRTGYTWEQYDPVTGVGRRNRPFSGWTSMVVPIMAERFP